MIDASFRRAAFGLSALLLCSVPAVANAADSSAAPMRTIQQFIAAMDKGDLKSADATFDPKAAEVTDDFAPHHWSGSHAMLAWAKDFGKLLEAAHITEPNIVVTASKHTAVEATHAFAPLPTIYTYKLNGKSMRETGVLVFALEKTAGAWKIVSMSWAPTP